MRDLTYKSTIYRLIDFVYVLKALSTVDVNAIFVHCIFHFYWKQKLHYLNQRRQLLIPFVYLVGSIGFEYNIQTTVHCHLTCISFAIRQNNIHDHFPSKTISSWLPFLDLRGLAASCFELIHFQSIKKKERFSMLIIAERLIAAMIRLKLGAFNRHRSQKQRERTMWSMIVLEIRNPRSKSWDARCCRSWTISWFEAMSYEIAHRLITIRLCLKCVVHVWKVSPVSNISKKTFRYTKNQSTFVRCMKIEAKRRNNPILKQILSTTQKNIIYFAFVRFYDV